jgi:FKBP-type peptidyl-prolyl cis-trans isomerase (trigger factor)
MTYEEMLEYVGLTDETLRARAEANAMKDIAVYSIAKAENITISDAEYEEKLAAYAESQGYTKDEILEIYTKKELIDQFTYNAVYDVIESWQNIITE